MTPRVAKWRLTMLMMADPVLGDGARRVGAALLDFHNNATGRCYPSYRAIGERVNVDRRTAMRGVLALVERGYFTCNKVGGAKANVYVPNLELVSGETPPIVSAVSPGAAPEVVTDRAQGGDRSGHQVVSAVSPQPVKEPSKKPSRTHARTREDARSASLPGGSVASVPINGKIQTPAEVLARYGVDLDWFRPAYLVDEGVCGEVTREPGVEEPFPELVPE